MLTEEEKKIVASLYCAGWNPEDIAEEYGFDETEVINYCCEIL